MYAGISSLINIVWFIYYRGLKLRPQQQPGSYRGGDGDDEMSVSLVEETGEPRGNRICENYSLNSSLLNSFKI